MRGVAFPTGRCYSQPSDSLKREVAQLVSTNSEVREVDCFGSGTEQISGSRLFVHDVRASAGGSRVKNDEECSWLQAGQIGGTFVEETSAPLLVVRRPAACSCPPCERSEVGA